ncbi:lysozyme [Microvirga tunisiensis]|uniref:Lysozyme n=1 Tax=Pannonibacter tanglangensis TaxID=2750084 RepID=A0A7X5F2A6_9HYPH|nr:peptidoglycan-binding protein [Pannonibacter sp. XCT-53]NBN78457.1 lysozyme [Pannonibacter sp. XCT-53]
MQVSPQGLAFIARHEGFVGRAYLDPGGVPTIGYGFTEGSRLFRSWWQAQGHAGLVPGQTIAPAAALSLLRELVDREYGPMVTRALGPLPQTAFDAAVSAVYNLGPRALGWRWAKALKAGDLATAAACLARTGTTAGGRVLPGLVRRRADEAALMAGQGYGLDLPHGSAPDPDIRRVQRHLTLMGYRPGPVDGRAGPLTRRAVARFQADHPPLAVDGTAGPATRAALGRAMAARAGLAGSGGCGAAASGTAAAQGVPVWDCLLIAGGVIAVAGLLFLAWQYRGRIRQELVFWRQGLSGTQQEQRT